MLYAVIYPMLYLFYYVCYMLSSILYLYLVCYMLSSILCYTLFIMYAICCHLSDAIPFLLCVLYAVIYPIPIPCVLYAVIYPMLYPFYYVCYMLSSIRCYTLFIMCAICCHLSDAPM